MTTRPDDLGPVENNFEKSLKVVADRAEALLAGTLGDVPPA
jgi:hypothetical protein